MRTDPLPDHGDRCFRGLSPRGVGRDRDPDVAGDLRIPVSEPVLAVERTIFDEAGAPVEFLRSWYRSDLRSYTVNFTRE